MEQKRKLIEDLTGVNSSKLNYYLELKKRNEEVIKQNNRLEIVHQIVKDINIDMSIEDIIHRAYGKLPLVLPCDFLGLALIEGSNLKMKVMVPLKECMNKKLANESLLWECIREKEYRLYDFTENKNMCAKICGGDDFKEQCIGSLVTVPLFVRGKAIGMLALAAQKKNVYNESELGFCRHLADQLAVCIENARLYEEVMRSKREWEETFASVIDPLYLIDLDFNVIRSNNRDNPLATNAQTAPGGQKCYNLIWGYTEKCKSCLMDQVLATGKPANHLVQVNGLVLDMYYYPVFNSNNEIYAIIHHIQDKTEKVKMEAQLIQLAKLAAIGEMAAGVAHELNSPMTVIIGTAQMLLRELGNDEHPRTEFLQDVVNCGLRCKRIIQNLLTFSRQDQHPVGATDLNEQVNKVLSLTQYQINRNKVTIKTHLADNLPPVEANAHQLQQVLTNFFLNARDALANKEGEKIITVSTGLSKNDRGEEQIWLAVEDNGEGIESDRLEKIFNPFYTSKEATKGTGLGLSVSLGIAQAHGGTIEVESVPGEGSVFRLVLPLVQAACKEGDGE